MKTKMRQTIRSLKRKFIQNIIKESQYSLNMTLHQIIRNKLKTEQIYKQLFYSQGNCLIEQVKVMFDYNNSQFDQQQTMDSEQSLEVKIANLLSQKKQLQAKLDDQLHSSFKQYQKALIKLDMQASRKKRKKERELSEYLVQVKKELEENTKEQQKMFDQKESKIRCEHKSKIGNIDYEIYQLQLKLKQTTKIGNMSFGVQKPSFRKIHQKNRSRTSSRQREKYQGYLDGKLSKNKKELVSNKQYEQKPSPTLKIISYFQDIEQLTMQFVPIWKQKQRQMPYKRPYQ